MQYRGKEQEVNKKELLTVKVLKYQAGIRYKEGERRLKEERGLVGTLREIVKKMNKKIAETAQEREEIREQVLR